MKRKNVIALILCLALVLSGCSGLLDKLSGKDKWQEQYDLGMRYLEDGDYEEAILAFSAAIEIDDSHPEAYMARAEAYMAVDEPEKALKDYKKARKLAKNEDDEDLADELEDLIEELEEIIDHWEEPTDGTDDGTDDGPGDGWVDFRITVTDVFTDTATDHYFDSTYCYHIPQINLPGDRAADVNAQIYDMLYGIIQKYVYDSANQYGYITCGNIHYTWGIRDGIVSVTILEENADYYWNTFYVYNVSVETGELVSDEELLAVFGLDRNGFYEMARATLNRMFDDYDAELIEAIGRDFFDYMVSMTLSEETLSEAMPYIGPDGTLCMAAIEYSAAGAGYYWHTYNLETRDRQRWEPCEADHPAPDEAYTAEEITQMVAQWYNWNVGGYESGTHVAFDSETTVSDGTCYVVVRFQNSDPDYTGGANVLVTVAEVNMTTGEMWSDGYFRGYLW